MKRILSMFLALVMVVGSFTAVTMASTVMASAENDTSYASKVDEDGNPVFKYLENGFQTAEDKLATMTPLREQDGYIFYLEEFTGEVALYDTESGETLFSNPYDLSVNHFASKSTREKLLSQLAVTYTYNGAEDTMYSYSDAALLNQITYKFIKDGVRVEYTIGETLTTRLVPRMINKERFESMILSKIPEGSDKERVKAFYSVFDPFNVALTETQVKEIQAAFPITKKFAIYVCEANIQPKELKEVEQIIKTYCPLYTYEEMEQDHNDCEYVSKDVAPPNFKMAIEYTISEEGLEARLPANGIRFDESTYTLKTVTMLPYMGAGRSTNTGYTFVPDGSGTLIRFEDLNGSGYNVSGKMYGADYAYHTISGQHTETMTMPVYGVVENVENKDTGAYYDRGFLAIITEGDSMATIMSEHNGIHEYNSIYPIFEPRPSDSYNLADSISVSSSASWTVTSSRKYAGSYRIKYIMLGDEDLSEDAGREEGDYYECSYVGMAKAYREYLEGAGIIKRLDAKETGKDMPLYIETFGAMQTVDRVMSFPVNVDVALTTFDEVQTMYDELAEKGVSNINFKLTGYYNGGLECTYLSKLSWEKIAGGANGFKSLASYAEEKGFGVYPEFDFAYQRTSDWFDGVSEKRDLVKSIDDRYMSKREYDAAMQSFESDTSLAISASAYEYFFKKFDANYSKYNAKSVSVSTLGTDLNSDFNEDDPFNREDSKAATVDLLAKLSEKYDVMVNGGNAYSVQYADHVTGIAIESSSLLKASEKIPFVTMVLHGYLNYSGSALNMEGDVQNAILNSIENGASLYFTLVYGNTTALKESSEYNKYYSISYDIWKDEMVEYYEVINEALGDLQTSIVVDHDFLAAARDMGEDTDYNRYATESGSVVYVEYDNGVFFIINYNSYDIVLELDGETYNVPALDFVRVD